MAEFSYDLDMFDAGTSAPEVVPERKSKPKKKLQLVEETTEVKIEKQRLQGKRSVMSTAAIVVVAAIITTIASLFVYCGAYINQYEHKIAAKQEELDLARGENVRLNMKRNALISYDSIRDAAEEKGMIQRDRYEVEYVEIANENYGVANPEN